MQVQHIFQDPVRDASLFPVGHLLGQELLFDHICTDNTASQCSIARDDAQTGYKGQRMFDKKGNKTSSGAEPNSARKPQKCDRRNSTDSRRVRFFGIKADGSWRTASMTSDADKSEKDVE